MDIDRFIATNSPNWRRLDELVRKGRRSPKRLSNGELDELLGLYQSASADLSTVRTQFNDVTVSNKLSSIVGAASGLIYRKPARPAAAFVRFFTETFPAAAFKVRWAIAVAAFLTFVPALGFGFWLSASGEVRNVAIDEGTQRAIADSQFEDYYKSAPAEQWAFELFTHNIQVSVGAYAGSAMGGVLGGTLLLQNAENLGANAAVMHAHGAGAKFWGLLIPHGLIELTAVCVSAGAGLWVAWAFVVPGDRTRGQAFAEEGLRSIIVMLGAMVLLVAAGFTEAFVTPSGLPTWTRITIGVLLESLALLWMFGRGWTLSRAGLTGRFQEDSLAEIERKAAQRAALTAVPSISH